MKLVLDASVALSWLQLPSQTCSAQALAILEDLADEPALVPPIWALEVAQGALRIERQQQATPDMLAAFSARLNMAPVISESRPTATWLPRSISLARRHALTVYDASYLELALWHDAALATFDKRLAQAAHACDVVVVGADKPVNRLESPVARYRARPTSAGRPGLTSPRTSSGKPAPRRGARQTPRRFAAAP
ncbi:type II toxin-antitoxin system VapC family toxin [Achromobacter sp.]|uniref:type II toxin-antitoxin system VapC family toxin n=1 Tax=Achromobacter sp. TaxID=134375 RepID=UPI0028A898E3|nr:type II toxin-antitoxin system VapC family toxin [Achromobacter sp.]